MRKLKDCSFGFIINIYIKKFFCFAILFTAVTFIVNGFFISSIYAESVTGEYAVTGGTDASGDVPAIFSLTEIEKLSTIDGNRIQSNGDSWPKTGSYDESKYIEFIFSPNVPEGATIESVTLTNNFRRSGALDEAKLEVWDGSNFVDYSIAVGSNSTTDNNEVVDVTSYINSPELVNNLIVRFLAYRTGDASTKTSHDFIGLTVVYTEEEIIPDPILYTEITEDISIDTTWSQDDSPYIVRSPIIIEEGATLTIDEGTIVKFDIGSALLVDGAINIEGGESNLVYFTSILDDSVGGDTNGDGDSSLPLLGDWKFLMIESPTQSSVLNNVVIKYSANGIIVFDSPISSSNLNTDQKILLFGSIESDFDELKAESLVLDKESSVSINNSFLYNTVFVSSSPVPVIIENKDEGKIKTPQNEVDPERLMYYPDENLLTRSEIYNLNQSSSNTYKITHGNSASLAILEKSYVDLSNSTIEGNSLYDSSNSSIFMEDESSLNTDNVHVFNNEGMGYGISAYDKSNLEIKNTNIIDVRYGFNTNGESSSIISDSVISCSKECVQLNASPTTITNSKISGANNNGIGLYNYTSEEDIPFSLIINNNEIFDNKYGIYVYAPATISGSNNSIHDNEFGARNNVGTNIIDLANNYWGDSTGPKHLTLNPSGLGNSVSDYITFAPFLLIDPFAEVLEVRHPVILIPGITGSYLMRGYGDKDEIWPDLFRILLPGDDSYLNDLALNTNGTENINYPITTGDIIRGISSVHVFDNLISDFEENGYVEGEDLFVFPYDWRFSTESTAELLKEKIDNIIANSEYEKVDIVAHSMGGLVAKKYIKDYGEEKIDQLIFLGTPQLGAPKAFKVLMFGDSMGYSKYLLGLNKLTAKYISQNMPSVYELLPSSKYTTENGSYVTDAMNEIIGLSSFELDYNQTKNLMLEKGRNDLMFPFAENLHDSIDDLNLSNIESYNFVGCGNPTIGEITVTQKKSWKKLFLDIKPDYRLGYTDGDETVPLVSADKTIGPEVFYTKGVSHGSLPNSTEIIEAILSILNNEEALLGDTLSNNNSFCGIEGDVVSTHSPVDLHVYDEEGNHTGINENGDIENGIVGVSLDVIEDVNYVFLPKGKNYKIITRATDTGGFNLKIEEQNGDDIVNSHNWTLIPLSTSDSLGEIWIGPDYSPEDYVVKMDDDGDGDTDNTYQENYDGTEEAEKIVYGNTEESHNTKSGSIPAVINKMVIPMIEKNFDTQNNENIVFDYKYDSQVEIDDIVQENFVEEDINQGDIEQIDNKNNYMASAGDSGIKVDLIWPAVIIFGLVLILLVKMFIKL